MLDLIRRGVLFVVFTIAHILGLNMQPPVTPVPASPQVPPIVATVATTTVTKEPLATSTLPKKVVPVKKYEVKPPVVNVAPTPITLPVPVPVPVPVPTPQADFEKINQTTRATLVNILCRANAGEISGISGTGVVIDPRGVILTNAHIGQYFLLKDFPQKDSMDCVIRTGSPAYPQYLAKLAYISPTWVENNKTILKDTEPKGTGENDFAILQITGATSGLPLPSSFAYVSPNTNEITNESQVVLLASYPAGFLGGQSVVQGLSVASAITKIQKVYTFKENTIDLISVGGTVISQRGASGGAVVDEKTKLIGLITTSSDAAATSERELNAITLAYISRTLQHEIGVSLLSLLSQDVSAFADTFQHTTAPLLTKIITNELSQ